MITIISPAKNMKVDKESTKSLTLPCYIEEAKDIWRTERNDAVRSSGTYEN